MKKKPRLWKSIDLFCSSDPKIFVILLKLFSYLLGIQPVLNKVGFSLHSLLGPYLITYFFLWFTNHLLNNWLWESTSESTSFTGKLSPSCDNSHKTSWKWKGFREKQSPTYQKWSAFVLISDLVAEGKYQLSEVPMKYLTRYVKCFSLFGLPVS